MKRREFVRRTSWAFAFFALLPVLSQGRYTQSRSRKLIVDADTGNEVDDLFAIVAALLAPSLRILGVTSAQYHTSPQAPNDSVGDSQRINREIMDLLGKKDVPHPEGSNIPLVNQLRPQSSDASAFIMQEARKMTEGEKLSIAVLGPCTNVASALLLEPGIADKIAVYYLGFWHNTESKTWSKREFNTNNDPNAVDVLLNHPTLEFHVMTATASQHLIFEKTIVDQHLKGKAGIADYLVDRWETFHRWWQTSDPEKKRWIMWDVALIMALAYPELASEGTFSTPDDNLKRDIKAYTWIDPEAMSKMFWNLLDEHILVSRH
ncbi:MAG: nucleoside hydrolase [Saprospiraceae bacterium]|nr:nucleoside hydrolase [Saprospiraceae bacterium]